MVNNYTKLKKQYKLPDQKKLMELLEMEIEAEKDTSILLQTIRNQIIDRIYDLMKTLEFILFTSEGSDPAHLYQEEMIRDVRKEGFEVYRNLNQLSSKGMRLRFSRDRKKDAAFINEVFSLWPLTEKTLEKFFAAIEDGWKEFEPSKGIKPETYHG
jgi:hypothetical protein